MLEAKESPAKLSDIIRSTDVRLDLAGTSQQEVLRELVSLLKLDPPSSETLVKVLQRRESMGSTGVGHGVAVPHCRTPLVDRMHVVFGRRAQGLAWCGADGEPVRFLFLLVAPPVEVSNAYLPVLGKVAQFVNNPETRRRLGEIRSPQEFLQLIADAGL